MRVRVNVSVHGRVKLVEAGEDLFDPSFQWMPCPVRQTGTDRGW